MVHLYFIGVFCIIFQAVIFFAAIIGLAGVYDEIISRISLITFCLLILVSVSSIFLISSTLKFSHINLQKSKADLIDNIVDENEKIYHIIPGYIPVLIVLTMFLYCYLSLEFSSHFLTNYKSLNIYYYFLFGVFIVSSIYFISILRINRLIKKYGITKNK